MSAAVDITTPVKLITDFFPKTPPSLCQQSDSPDKDSSISSIYVKLDSSPESHKDDLNQLNEDSILQSTKENVSTDKHSESDTGLRSRHRKNHRTQSSVKHKLTCTSSTSNKDDSKLKESQTVTKSSTETKSQTSSESSKLSVTTKKSGASKKTSTKKTSSRTQTENTLLTDYFPIRRSERRCQSKLKEDKEQALQDCIRNNCENGLKVVEMKGKGRGVEATKPFDSGDFVVEYAGELIELTQAKRREDNYSKDETTGCYMYYFEHKMKRYCVDATEESGRLGRLINHSKKGNCQTKVVEVDAVPRLILVALRHIRAGEELLYDYGDRSPASLEAHPWLKT